MSKDNNKLKKMIKYRLSHSGMKETDIIYEKLILKKLDSFNQKELQLLSNIFNEISDIDIFKMLTYKMPKIKKFKSLLDKILDE